MFAITLSILASCSRNGDYNLAFSESIDTYSTQDIYSGRARPGLARVTGKVTSISGTSELIVVLDDALTVRASSRHSKYITVGKPALFRGRLESKSGTWVLKDAFYPLGEGVNKIDGVR